MKFVIVRFFVCGFITFGILYYLIEPGVIAVKIALLGGASFSVSAAAFLILIKIYKDLLKT